MTAKRWLMLGTISCVGLALGVAEPVAQETPAPPAPAKQYRREYADFLARPKETQERLRRVDQEFREADAVAQAHLLQVMQRYHDWLERLKPEQRQRVEAAANTPDRIQAIREVREEQWIESLAKADREAIQTAKKVSEEERLKVMAGIREREQERDRQWQQALASAGNRDKVMSVAWQEWQKKLVEKLPTAKDKRQFMQETRSPRDPDAYRRLLELSKEHNIEVPQVFQYRRFVQENQPLWNDPLFTEFRETRLKPEVWKEFQNRLQDSEQRQQALIDLRALYWKAHPEHLNRTLLEDQDRWMQRGGPRKPPKGP